ncbi:hypothetical protein HMPREF1344_02295 [Enterococcus faecalis R508]|nr:hypothetical protein HMPREF9499_00217 [Enterococcus faecalis TX0012]EJV36337.1 hypothetical protein HMPREF1344_02295 [Enterococcus faecalis R508]EPH72073.1 hypothetical protein D929_01992 [Enterococcus faecalis 02-MB-P-10]EPH81013.1 hypothetical protein D925_01488 [Enterococcus faecalis B83616-1]
MCKKRLLKGIRCQKVSENQLCQWIVFSLIFKRQILRFQEPNTAKF